MAGENTLGIRALRSAPAPEGHAADAEETCCLCAVAAGKGKGARYVAAVITGGVPLSGGCGKAADVILLVKDFLNDTFVYAALLSVEGHKALHHVHEFPDIARPVVLLEQKQRSGRKTQG